MPAKNDYGQASYIRLLKEKGRIHCSLIKEKLVLNHSNIFQYIEWNWLRPYYQ